MTLFPHEPVKRNRVTFTGAELAVLHTYDPPEEMVPVTPLPPEHPDDETTTGSWRTNPGKP